MIWARRIRSGGDDGAWAVPFADLVTLLLVVFVLIVSMSETRSARFEKLGQSMRRALGHRAPLAAALPESARARPTLRGRIEADLTRLSEVRLTGPDDETLPPCVVIEGVDRLVLHVAADDAFMGPTAVLAPRTKKLIACLADHLRDGRARLQVRGYGPEGVVPPGLPYRDRMDIACERARSVRQELASSGVAEVRLDSAATELAEGGRGFEITLFASPPGDPSGTARESVASDG